MSADLTKVMEETIGGMAAAINSLADSQKSQADMNAALYKILGAGEKEQKRLSSQKHSMGAPATTAEHRPLHEDAFWRDCQLDPMIINRIVSPVDSFMNILPTFGTIVADKKFGFLTGATVSGLQGTAPADNCAPCRTLDAEYKGCKVSMPMGRSCVRSKTLETNELFRRACLRLAGDDVFIEGSFSGFVGGDGQEFSDQMQDRDFLVASAVKRQFWRIGRYMQDFDARSFWSGNPVGATNDARQYWGMSSLIRADYHTMTGATGPGIESGGTGTVTQINACAALNSDLKDFNGNCIGGNQNILYWLESMANSLRKTARGIGALPVEWGIVMTAEHWAELSRYLPCMKAFMDCGSGNGLATPNAASPDRVTLDGATIINERDRLTESGVIMLNGFAYPVYVDDYVPYTEAPITVNGQDRISYSADIWFIPLTGFGGIPLAYFEHMDYSQIGQELAPLNINDVQSTLEGFNDGGRFHSVIDYQGYCFAIQTKSEKRLVLQCPSLSGRLMNVNACPLQSSPRAIQTGQPLGTAYARLGVTATAPAP